MRLLLINPNTSADLTTRMASLARSQLGPDVEVLATTAERGVPYIASRAEADIAAVVVLETIAAHHSSVDAAIIAAFGDPGLLAARELFAIPVVAMADAAVLTACALGRRYAIATFSPTLLAWYRDAIELTGLANRCVGIEAASEPFASIASVREEARAALIELVRRLAEERRADVAILAGAPLSGLARELGDDLAIPAVDPLAAAVLQAEALVRLGAVSRRSAPRPPAKPTANLDRALARRIEHDDESR